MSAIACPVGTARIAVATWNQGPGTIMTSATPRNSAVAVLILTALSLAGCGNRSQETAMTASAKITAAQMQAVAARQIVFGHRSVGANILDGLRLVAAQTAVELPITESRDGSAGPGITHFGVGRNGDPLGKIADFAQVVAAGGDAEFALLKLCYIDFPARVDPVQVAQAYCDTLDSLAGRFPRTTFVAVTAPLTAVQSGPKALVKKALGRVPSGYVENARRQQFNEILRRHFGPDRRLFDLAAIEAEGSPSCRYENRDVECLNPALTTDGGHLNRQGSELVAVRLVQFLAAAPVRGADR